MSERTILESEKIMTKEEVADFLEKTASRIREGKLSLVQNGSETEFDLPNKLEFEIKVEEEPKQNSKKHSIEFEIEWEEGQGSKSVELK